MKSHSQKETKENESVPASEIDSTVSQYEMVHFLDATPSCPAIICTF
jgi:hypothetical protein